VRPTITPLWLDEPYDARPAPGGPVTAEVVVVGAGIGGVAAAWQLARRGIDVAVLEAREVASGASGRNGGFFIAGPAPMYDRARTLLGAERARRIYAATLETQRQMLALAEAVGARPHFRIVGLLRLGVDAQEAGAVRAHHAALAEDGFPGELVEPEALPAAVARPDRLGLLTAHDGAVQPVRWIRALADAAEREGARIFERTRVTSPPRADGDGVLVETDAGTVRAERALVAMDAALAGLVPAAAGVRSRRLNMVATAPAPAALPFPIYARDGHEYAQQLADGRVALGGFSDLDGAAGYTDREELSAPVQAQLERYLGEELGIRAPVTHRWVGLVGYAEVPLPVCGIVPGTGGRIAAIGGYNGTGHVQGFLAARIAVAELLGERDPEAGLYAAPGAAPVGSGAAPPPA
jgi:glycine/D-amino acid oxidase-like deaminating enzyme